MSTITTNNATETTASTENNSGSSSLPEASKSSFVQARVRQEMARTLATIRDAIKDESLNDWDKDFLTSIADRFAKYGLKTRLTLAQVMTINRALIKHAKAA